MTNKPKADMNEIVEDRTVAPKVDGVVANMFTEEAGFTKEFQNKAQVIFEAAVAEAVETEKTKITNEATETLNSKVAEITEELQRQAETDKENYEATVTENLNNYIKYVVENFMEENRIAIEDGMTVSKAKNVIESLREILSEESISVPEHKNDQIVSEALDNFSEAKTMLADLVNENAKLVMEIENVKAEQILESNMIGMSDTQKDRFKKLSSNLLGESSLDEFEEKLQVIKEAFIVGDGDIGTNQKGTNAPARLTTEGVDVSSNIQTNTGVDELVAQIKLMSAKQ
jgi:hypothetical protein